MIAGTATLDESSVIQKKSAKQRRAATAQKKSAGGQTKNDHLTEGVFANMQYLAPDFQILLLERLLKTYTSKKQFEDEVDFFYPFSVSVIMTTYLFFTANFNPLILFRLSVSCGLRFGSDVSYWVHFPVTLLR